MNDLIERIEAAREDNADLFRAAATAVFGFVPNAMNRFLAAGAFTDAALALVPEGWRVSKLEQHWRSGRWIAQLCERPTERQLQAFDDGVTIGWNTADTDPDAATPALAICAAALKARAYLKETNNAD